EEPLLSLARASPITTPYEEMIKAIHKDTAMSREAYPIEVEFPDIAQHEQSSSGIAYVHTFDSGMPGPHVMINALTHGNELCGAIAVDAPLAAGVRPAHGRLPLLFATVDPLLDIPSMQERAEPLMLTGPHAKGVALGYQVGAPSHLMIDAGRVAG